MDRIEEFTREKMSFIYFDLSGFQKLDDYIQLFETAKRVIAKYPKFSVHTITNVSHIRLDSNVKEVFAKWIEHNNPYVKYGVIIGGNCIKKIMFNSILSISERKNLVYLPKKEDAIAWLLDHETVNESG